MKSRVKQPIEDPTEVVNLSASSYVTACIRLANWRDGDDPAIRDRAIGEIVTDTAAGGRLYESIGRGLTPGAKYVPTEGLANPPTASPLRQRLAQRLAQFLEAKGRKRDALRAIGHAALDQVRVTATLELREDGHLEEVCRYFPGSDDGAEGLLIAFLLDPRRPFGSALRRCALDSCARFFLALKNPEGGPRPRYCPGTDHQRQADALKAKHRVQAYRERNATKRK